MICASLPAVFHIVFEISTTLSKRSSLVEKSQKVGSDHPNRRGATIRRFSERGVFHVLSSVLLPSFQLVETLLLAQT